MSSYMTMTNELRYVRRLIKQNNTISPTFKSVYVIQQAWRDMATGKLSWRDLPIIDEITGEPVEMEK